MKTHSLCLGVLGALTLALGTACTEAGNSNAGTALYAFDATNKRILAWDDVSTLYTSGSASSVTAATPDRTITSSDYLGSFSTLGRGGMCMDRSRNRLWLVSTSGLIARIDSIRSRPDGADLTDTYVRTFQLGTSSSDRLDGSIFGQMAVDVSTGALYITEYSTGSDDSRIWVLSSPTSYANNDEVASSSITLVTTSGDTYGYGVAVGSSSKLFGYFGGGSTIKDGNDESYTGARLRMGTASGGFSSVIVGTSNTALAGHGTLGADTSNSLVYVAPYSTSSAIIAFKTSKFTTGYDVAPSITLPSNSTTAFYVRAIAHPGNKNWLVGVGGTSSGDSNHLSLWKSPSSNTTAEPIIFSYGSSLGGIALDGSASSD